MGALWRTGVAWPEVVCVDVAGRRSDPLLIARRCELASDKDFLRRKNILLAEKNISCGEKYFLRKNIFLAEKNLFLAEKNMFLAEKNIFLAEKNISCGKKNISCGKIFLYHVTNKLPYSVASMLTKYDILRGDSISHKTSYSEIVRFRHNPKARGRMLKCPHNYNTRFRAFEILWHVTIRCEIESVPWGPFRYTNVALPVKGSPC